MNLKTLAFSAVAAAAIAAPGTASAQFDAKTLETVAAMILAEKLGLDTSSLLQTALGANASVYDMAPVFVMQRSAPRSSTSSIWEMRKQGMGWGEIAHAVGMQPGEFNKLRNSGQLDNNLIWRSRYQNRFGLTSSQIDYLRSKGLTWREIGAATLIARESGNSVNSVAGRYLSNRSWDRVASQYRVSGPLLAKRVSSWRTTKTIPANWRTEAKQASKSHSSSTHGSAAIKMNGHEIAHEKSNGKGHEKHHEEKSHGKGHGGGH